ncbi:MAG: sulfate reduction electron transfer complex DsrMKJOP subunit DsrM [Nitrospirota bacterium]|jgi:nitrate reductase gamma subunit
MGMLFSLFVVIALVVAAYVIELAGGMAGSVLLGVIIPYAAVAVFLGGFVYKIFDWARSPVPFRIPTTSGQQKSLPWIKRNKLDNPSGTLGVIGRMFLEIFLFRSLFKNTKADLREEGPRLVYGSSKWLWMAGLAFHWSLLFIVVRHFRLFVEPVPAFVNALAGADGFLQLTLPDFYITDAVILLAVTYLFLRRVAIPQLKTFSLAADYFPLFLILGIAGSGVLMRYVTKVNIVGVKSLVNGLFTFHPNIPEGIGSIFYIHLLLVSALLVYFPFSKLMHMGGVWMSPTRNLSNNSRVKRHINPWNPDVKFHTYEEYEDDFRKFMKMVGLPVEKDEEEEE